MAEAIQEDLKKCAFCKKTTKKAKKYYRNGKYYCNMNCWSKAKAQLKEAESAGTTEEPADTAAKK